MLSVIRLVNEVWRDFWEVEQAMQEELWDGRV